ncbi:hypothetical protein [Mycolicibacterium grossiae]|uniref:Uncharacterized protein n=1 Tax=Mycolicibacterium grossiae TaxID=1552759 RepID=A0A1E8Q2T2_9MYCO|nr:hypothetical protein [Mycolicibacterium grossiae]OFJ52561.1 hypothetical protein BEL07_17100 [Mycolicibacterium grossiae]QEM47178.1 hypothetical protein FZ046_22520 [Mycolicibacterium grossiae]
MTLFEVDPTHVIVKYKTGTRQDWIDSGEDVFPIVGRDGKEWLVDMQGETLSLTDFLVVFPTPLDPDVFTTWSFDWRAAV